MEKLYKILIGETLKAREFSYSPYSNFKVGCSVLMEDNKIFSGCNIENVSFGATNCAERTAIFKAISEGYNNIQAICIVGSLEELTYPCGICRQVIIEFSNDFEIPIIIAKSVQDYKVHKLSEIATFVFHKKHLDK